MTRTRPDRPVDREVSLCLKNDAAAVAVAAADAAVDADAAAAVVAALDVDAVTYYGVFLQMLEGTLSKLLWD